MKLKNLTIALVLAVAFAALGSGCMKRQVSVPTYAPASQSWGK